MNIKPEGVGRGGRTGAKKNFFLVGPILTQKIATGHKLVCVRSHTNLHDKAKVLCKH